MICCVSLIFGINENMQLLLVRLIYIVNGNASNYEGDVSLSNKCNIIIFGKMVQLNSYMEYITLLLINFLMYNISEAR